MLSFDFYSSGPFWLAFLVIVFFLRLFGFARGAKKWLLLVSSCLMLLAIPAFTLIDLAIATVFALISFAASWLLTRTPAPPGSKGRFLIGLAAVLFALLFLSFFKYEFVQHLAQAILPSSRQGAGGFIRMIGISYFTFRIVDVIVESYRSKIAGLNLVTYLNYIVFFPSFISGPINRYNQFAESFEKPDGRAQRPDVLAGAERIVHGLFKKFVLVQLLLPHILTAKAGSLAGLSFHEVLLGLYAYAFYFYFDFSGYTDLALGCARILGIVLPENFNNPFLKRNIRELWTNWHMSLTSWLVDYIYWPLVRKLRNLDSFRTHPIVLSNLGMIITFIVCGMWHGEGLNFIVWGAYHGFGIAAVTTYQRLKRGVKVPMIQRYFRSKASEIIGIFATFNYFALGLSFFVLDWGDLRVLWNTIASNS